jgi:DNA polymerase-1
MFLLIDGNNLAWAGYYALERAMKPEDDERRARIAMLGLAGAVLGVIARGGEPPGAPAGAVTRVAICFDEGRPLRRRAMFPPYQTGRERDPKFVANEPTILAAIAEFAEVAVGSLPVEIVRGENTEADDLIAGLVQANKRTNKRIVSTDRDFLQLIDERTSIYAPVKKVVIDAANFEEAVMPKGCRKMFVRQRYLDYRALIGDPSDDLQGVPGVGPVTAVAMLVHAPLDIYFDKAGAIRTALGRKSERIERAFMDGSARETVERNRTLMDLRLPAPSWAVLDELTTRGTWDRAEFEAWFGEQRFSGVDGPALFASLEELSRKTRPQTA